MQSAAFVAAEDPYTYVAIVTPMTADPATSGKIKHLPCAPQVKHKWIVSQVVGRNRAGEVVDFFIAPLAARVGYILLRDLYMAEGNPEGWAEYERHMKAIAAGQKVKPFPADKLPREVLRRRACGLDPEVAEAPKGKARG